MVSQAVPTQQCPRLLILGSGIRANQINRLAGSTFPVMWLCPRCVRRSIGGRPGDLRCFLISNALAVALFGLCKHALIRSWADGEPAEAANLGIHSSGSFWPRVADARLLSAQRCQGAALTPRISGYDSSLLAQKDQPPHSLRPPRPGRLVEHWAASNVEPHSHTMSRSIGCSRARCGDPPRHRIAGRLFRASSTRGQPT